ncbi:speriolin [Lepus europaeus]|uniref:speriolin n=1 Tax=Lepus europaeus TaxID=9983 RepID=UPI002B48706F|nr:speriolin [Lepus europaeus]
MSLLTNYEGLRHQIERLVRENEELKKLVRLIRENHELKSAIKTQAGGLNISGFTSGLGEAVAASAPRQGNSVFLPSAAATANEPTLEEMGLTALAPLADMLSSPQPSPLVSPLTGPLSSLLTGPAPVSQSTPISSLLNGPVAAPTMGTLASSLGMISTGSLTPSSPLAGPLAVSQSGPLMAPMGGPVTVSLSSPLLSSTAAPIGVSQNLLASPMGNLVLSETPRVRLAEPHSSAATPKAPLSPPLPSSLVPLPAEHARMTQDPEPHSVAFVGTPLQTSTPMGSVATPIPSTAFSFSASDPRAQPGAPQGQMVPAAVPASPQLPVLTGTTTPAPQPPGGYTSSTTHVAPQSPARVQHSSSRPLASPHSPPRNAHSSPSRTASSPASVNDTRAPSTAEPARKSVLELERKLTHRKTSKFPDSSRESKQLAWERLVGEIAFQLDRRILSSIFPERVRLYGFTVSNIPEKIIQASLNPSDHKLDEELCQTLTQRYVSIMNRLQSLGYNGRVHPALTEQLVNAYGILRERPELAASEGGSYTVDFLQRVLVETVHPSMLTDALLLLSCLNQLAHDDGKPMFIW